VHFAKLDCGFRDRPRERGGLLLNVPALEVANTKREKKSSRIRRS
jgi:hypothetical protein